ncbi:hypothetical protein LXA43DRAFT_1093283 [Ganoderma leucocontextum]|nr:hypothetical protein LXA43DRAFT_1093283 [Ganoderma leucocontextum]
MIASDPSLRLPTYRSTHVARFHPYPRGGSRRSEDVFTDPSVHVEEPSSNLEPAQPRIRPTRRCAAAPDNDVSSFELDIPVVGVQYDEDELLAAGIPTAGLSQSKLALVLSDLLGALRRAVLQGTSSGFKFGVKLFK